MVDDPAITGPYSIAGDVLVLVQVGRDDEASIDILARRRGWRSHCRYRSIKSGVPSCHSSANFGGCGRSAGSPSGAQPRTRRRWWRYPCQTRTALVLELDSDMRDRLPRGHRSILDDRGDVARPFSGLLVGHQRERTDLARTMAFLAILLDDRCDILACRWDGRRPRVPRVSGSRWPRRAGVLTSFPDRTAVIASLSSLPLGLAFRTRRATNWSSIRP